MGAIDYLDAFRKAMADAGVRYSGPIDGDGKRHRVHLDDDKKGRRNGWYIYHNDDRPAGAFGTWKDAGITYTWSATGLARMSDEERAAMRERQRRDREAAAKAEAERHAAAAARARRMWEAAEPATEHPYLARKGVPAYGLRVGTWEKELPPDPHTGEVRTIRHENALLIPLRDGPPTDTAIMSLQAVFAKPVRIAGEDRDKDFVYRGRKRGCWFSIGKPAEIGGKTVIVICEGYATGASIHHATGLAVMVAFDAGNLLPVAEIARSVFPAARIVIAADNDQFTEFQGKPYNPGLEKGRAAAEAIGGELVYPIFKVHDERPTDFNDLDVNEGLEEVARQIMAVVSPLSQAFPEKPKRKIDTEADGFATAEDINHDETFFRVVGHDDERLYVYQKQMRMVVERRLDSGSESSLIPLAPLHWWEREFPARTGFNKRMAQNWLVQTAFSRGYFDPDIVRGRGAWRDAGRTVYHFGDSLAVDGQAERLECIQSRFVYMLASPIPRPSGEPMSDREGELILKTAKLFAWMRPASGLLLSGWVALAPLCGALRWRPHIWITGGAGSGKSTILTEFVKPLLSGTDLFLQGNSTEAGIRQTLKTDALPILIDESEQNSEREAERVQTVLAMLRQASTETQALTVRGSPDGRAQKFLIRSMACLSSVQVGLDHQADRERITVLSLKPKRRDGNGANAAWDAVRQGLLELNANAELPAKLLCRSLRLLPITLQNITVFSRAATEKFGSQRKGDQYGALLSGAWSLIRQDLVTLESARDLIEEYDWSEHVEDSDGDDASNVLEALMSARIQPARGVEVSVSELVALVSGRDDGAGLPARDEVERLLAREGFLVKVDADGEWLYVATGQTGPQRLLKGSSHGVDLRGQLLRIPGVREPRSAAYFLKRRKRCVYVPLSVVFDDGVPDQANGTGDSARAV